MNYRTRVSLPLSAATLLLVVGVQFLIAAAQSENHPFMLSFLGGLCLMLVPISTAIAVLTMVDHRLRDTVRRR